MKKTGYRILLALPADVKRVHFWLLLGVFLLVNVLQWYRLGFRDELHDATGYIRAGAELTTSLTLTIWAQVFYIIPIALIGICYEFLNGTAAVIYIQTLISFMASLYLYKATFKLSGNTTSAFAAALIFVSWWEAMQWNSTLLTESLFLSLLCFFIYHVVNGSKYWSWLLLVALCFTRPTGFVVAFSYFAYIIFFGSFKETKSKVSAISILVALIVLVSAFMFSLWDFTEQYLKGNIITYIDSVKTQFWFGGDLRIDTQGIIAPDADQHPFLKILSFIIHNPLYFIKSASAKIFFLVAGVRPYYSLSHNLYLIVWHTGLYTSFFIGLRRFNNPGIKLLLVLIVILNIVLIGCATVDWDNRFYIIMVPSIAIVAGHGASLVSKSVSSAIRLAAPHQKLP